VRTQCTRDSHRRAGMLLCLRSRYPPPLPASPPATMRSRAVIREATSWQDDHCAFCGIVAGWFTTATSLLARVVCQCREIFRILELMHLDLANFTITQLKPYIQQQSVEYERQTFTNLLKTQDGEPRLRSAAPRSDHSQRAPRLLMQRREPRRAVPYFYNVAGTAS